MQTARPASMTGRSRTSRAALRTSRSRCTRARRPERAAGHRADRPHCARAVRHLALHRIEPTYPMSRSTLRILIALVLAAVTSQPISAADALPATQAEPAHNPVIWADVPDIAIIRVGKTYYMSSTTMHMSPGLPIMMSSDLINWRMASYAYDTLA